MKKFIANYKHALLPLFYFPIYMLIFTYLENRCGIYFYSQTRFLQTLHYIRHRNDIVLDYFLCHSKRPWTTSYSFWKRQCFCFHGKTSSSNRLTDKPFSKHPLLQFLNGTHCHCRQCKIKKIHKSKE